MAYRDRHDDWAQEVPQNWSQGPYEDYGWERGQSVLPQFRDPSVHQMPYERQEGGYYSSEKSSWRVPGPHVGRGPRNYQRSSESIREDVCERLTYHGYLDASDIEIEVRQGEVTLRGAVPDRRSKRLAEDLAASVSGVRDVHNRLICQPGYTTARSPQATQSSQKQERGLPGGGQGRVDQVGRSGVYPASAEEAPADAEARGMASWGQGERDAAGYEDSGTSEVWYTEEERRKARQTEE